MGLDDLDQIGANEGQRDRHLERTEELRQRFGQGDFPEDGEPASPQRAKDIPVLGLQRVQAHRNRYSDREEADHEGHQHGVGVVSADEQQRDHRYHGRLWYGVEADQQRVERISCDLGKAHDHPQQRANEDRDQQSEHGPPQRLPAIEQEQLPVLGKGTGQVAGRGHLIVWPVAPPHQQFPQNQEDNDRHQRHEDLPDQPALLRVHQAASPCCSSARSRPCAIWIWRRSSARFSTISGR